MQLKLRLGRSQLHLRNKIFRFLTRERIQFYILCTREFPKRCEAQLFVPYKGECVEMTILRRQESSLFFSGGLKIFVC